MNWNILVNWVDNDPLHWAIAVLVTIASVGFIILCVKGGLRLFRILRERHQLTNQNHCAQQRIISKAEDIKLAWSSSGVVMRAERITSTPRSMLKVVSHAREELEKETSQATSYVRTKNEREEIRSIVDWPYWLLWKVIYFVSEAILLFIPANSRSRLQKQLDTLTALERKWNDNYGPLKLKEFREASILTTKKEEEEAELSKQNFYEQRDLKRKREILKDLKKESLENLNYLIQRASNTAKVGETPPTHDSRCLNFETARKRWIARFADLCKLEHKGNVPLDQLIELFQSFGQNFLPVPGEKDKIPAVELRAKHVADAERKLDIIVDAFQELSNEMGCAAEIPKALTEAEKILSKDLLEQWANLDNRFEESLKEAEKILDSAYDVTTTLRLWSGLIVSMRERVAWLKEMQDYATGVHHVKIEKRDDWIKAVTFLEEKIPNLWAKLDIKGLESEFEEIRHAVELRKEVLASRVGEHARKCSLDPNLPKEALRSLNELQRLILQGPDGGKQIDLRQVSFQRANLTLTGPTVVTPMGTVIDAGLADSWMADDAGKKEKEDEKSKTGKVD